MEIAWIPFGSTLSSAWVPFGSAVAGAIVGGALSLAGALLATKWSVNSAVKIATDERIRREQQNIDVQKSAIVSEMRTATQVAMMPDTLNTNTFVLFSMVVWQSTTGITANFDADAAYSVRTGYSEMFLANAVAVQGLALPYGVGTLNDRYKQHVRAMAGYFEQAVSVIESTLADDGIS